MINTVVGLIIRDCCILLHQWRRLLIYCGSIFFLDMILLLYEQDHMLKQEIFGVTVENFLLNPEKMPLQWIWNQIGIVLLTMDFVRKDLCQNTSCFFPRIQKRNWYWYSKLLCGGFLALGLSAFQMAEKSLILFLWGYSGNNIEIVTMMLLRSCAFSFLGMCTLYWLYGVISLLGNEIIGLTLCIAYVVLGLPVNVSMLYCGSFMYVRGTFIMAAVVTGVVFVGTLVVGIIKIKHMDILAN